MAEARRYATDNAMPFSMVNEANKLLERVRDGEQWSYQGPVKGIKISPHENADPLWLEFDTDLFLQDFCKTQFAGLSVHIKIIKFFEKAEGFFSDLAVLDEGEFWETHDVSKLEEHLDWCFRAMETHKKENPGVDGPYRMENERIIDLM